MTNELIGVFAELCSIANYTARAVKEFCTLCCINNSNKWQGKPLHRRQAYIKAKRNCKARRNGDAV